MHDALINYTFIDISALPPSGLFFDPRPLQSPSFASVGQCPLLVPCPFPVLVCRSPWPFLVLWPFFRFLSALLPWFPLPALPPLSSLPFCGAWLLFPALCSSLSLLPPPLPSPLPFLPCAEMLLNKYIFYSSVFML